MYIKRTTYLPYRIDVEKYHSGRYGSKTKPGKKVNPTTEQMEAANERRRIKKLYQKIAANFDFGDLHMQLTYRKNERPTPNEAREYLTLFLRKLRKEFKKRGEELKYIVTTEYKRAAIHHHLVINEIGKTAKLVNEVWNHGKAFFSVVYKNGDVEDLAAYLIKETQNSFRDKDNPSKLSYSCSRNLKKPKETVEVIKADSWLEVPTSPKGYWIPKDSIVTGISKVTGYPYQYYTCIKYDQNLMSKEEDWLKPRGRTDENKDYRKRSGNKPGPDAGD